MNSRCAVGQLALVLAVWLSLGQARLLTREELGQLYKVEDIRQYYADREAMVGLANFWRQKFTRKPEDPFEGPEIYVEAAKEELRRIEAKFFLSHEERLLKVAIKSLMNLVESSQCDNELIKDVARIYRYYFPNSKCQDQISDHVYHHYISRLDMDQCEQFIESKLAEAKRAASEERVAKFLASIKPDVSTEANKVKFERQLFFMPFTVSEFYIDESLARRQLSDYIAKEKSWYQFNSLALVLNILMKPCRELRQQSGYYLQAWLALEATKTRSRGELAFSKRDLDFKLMAYSNQVCRLLFDGSLLLDILNHLADSEKFPRNIFLGSYP